MGLSDGAKSEHFEPEVDKRGEAVVELGQVHVLGSDACGLPQPSRRLGAGFVEIIERPVQRQSRPGGAATGIARDVHRLMGRSLALSAEVRTKAATPSTGISQSNRRMGSASTGESR